MPRSEIKKSATKVLIADESPELAKTLSDALCAQGFDCIIAKDESDTLSRFFENMPDVVVLGFSIVKEGDGIRAAKEILANKPLTEILVLTDKRSRITKKEEQLGIELFISREAGLQTIASTVCAIRDLKKSACRLIAK